MSMRNVYRKIARKHGVTVNEVKEEMQAAIDCAYRKGDKTEAKKSIQNRVCLRDGIPAAEEVIQFVVREVKGNGPAR